MLKKNIKYYRLKNNMTKKALAEKIGVTPMAISNYEGGKRRPNMEIIKAMAKAFNIGVTDFLVASDANLIFEHGKFRKNTQFGVTKQEYIQESIEEYFGRFFMAVSFIGGTDVLKSPPELNKIPLTEDYEDAGLKLREYLGLPANGPIGNLISTLENRGVLVYLIDVDSRHFSGTNGIVNGLPYIVINQNMSPARIHSTIVHEIAHFAFDWPEYISDKEEERIATAISGAFLFPREDAIVKLGVHRNKVSGDMTIVCREYGISIFMLVKRARLCNIINDSVERDFYIKASKAGWKKNEPNWGMVKEEPSLFKQLVYRAISEDEISVQKGAEMLKTSYDHVVKECFMGEEINGLYQQ